MILERQTLCDSRPSVNASAVRFAGSHITQNPVSLARGVPPAGHAWWSSSGQGCQSLEGCLEFTWRSSVKFGTAALGSLSPMVPRAHRSRCECTPIFGARIYRRSRAAGCLPTNIS